MLLLMVVVVVVVVVANDNTLSLLNFVHTKFRTGLFFIRIKYWPYYFSAALFFARVIFRTHRVRKIVRSEI